MCYVAEVAYRQKRKPAENVDSSSAIKAKRGNYMYLLINLGFLYWELFQKDGEQDSVPGGEEWVGSCFKHPLDNVFSIAIPQA